MLHLLFHPLLLLRKCLMAERNFHITCKNLVTTGNARLLCARSSTIPKNLVHVEIFCADSDTSAQTTQLLVTSSIAASKSKRSTRTTCPITNWKRLPKVTSKATSSMTAKWSGALFRVVTQAQELMAKLWDLCM